MSNMLQPILAGLDPKVVYAVVVLFAIIIILAIVKKAAKIAIFMTILTACIYLLAPAAKDFQQNYSINVDKGAVHIVTDGQEYTIDDFAKIKEAKLVYNGKQEIDVKIKYADTFLNFTVPVFMGDTIKDYFDSHDVAYEVE